jgi:hypothetical protein
MRKPGRREVIAAIGIALAGTGWGHRSWGFTTRVAEGDGPVRYFDGMSAPDPADHGGFDLYAAFPNANDPFAINTDLRLGPGGWDLSVPDRGLAGVLPGSEPDWFLNMIPFGVAIDGVILDPSGPWYDGGPADPDNPFDRACTGWEYEVNDPRVAALVGMPDEVPGHVQPGGLFHYHGYPARMIAARRAAQGNPDGTMIVGYSADGFPIIDFRLRDAVRRPVELVSGYRLRHGPRVSVPFSDPAQVPEGDFDGLFVQDYVYDPPSQHDAADGPRRIALDHRNGIVLGEGLPSLPGYPPAHYCYALTPDWPHIPRVFAFRPDPSFAAIIPLAPRGLMRLAGEIGLPVQPTRSQLYANCPADRQAMRLPLGRAPY